MWFASEFQINTLVWLPPAFLGPTLTSLATTKMFYSKASWLLVIFRFYIVSSPRSLRQILQMWTIFFYQNILVWRRKKCSSNFLLRYVPLKINLNTLLTSPFLWVKGFYFIHKLNEKSLDFESPVSRLNH